MAPPFLVAGGASHWPSKAQQIPPRALQQPNTARALPRRDQNAAKRSDLHSNPPKTDLCSVFCAAPPCPSVVPPSSAPPAEDQERSTGPPHRTVPHGPARPVRAWLPGCRRLLGWPAKTRISLLALLSPHFFFFFRLLLPSSFDVDAVILLSSPSSYLLSPHKLPLHSFSGHSLLDILHYHHPYHTRSTHLSLLP
jgi:hypothetical protein